MNHLRPVTCGADQDEEEDIDCKSVKDGCDGAFRDGNTRSLQVPFRDMQSENKHQVVHVCVYNADLLNCNKSLV